VSFRRILIAVDGEPLAAHAAELGIELASSPGVEIAFVHAIGPGLLQAPGITPTDLIAEAEREGRRLIAGFCQLLPQTHAPIKLIRVGVVSFHEKAGPCQANSFTACHSLVTGKFPASRPGPVQDERSEPEGSLDGWPRCQIVQDEGMAGYVVRTSTLQRSSPHRPASIRTLLKP